MNPVIPKIIVTSDGSHSLFNEALNETYHSLHGALQESVYVFIQQGLQHYLQQHNPDKISILEVGFGTGLNALLTLQHAQQVATTLFIYNTLEAYPLPAEIWNKLNYGSVLGITDLFEKLHQLEWNEDHRLLPNFTFSKWHNTLEAVNLKDATYNLIYYDAFAPSKQPEMWTLAMLEKIAQALTPHGLFVTYCAKGQLKRDLKTLGFTVETLPGPPGKKEMTRAFKT